MLAIKKTRNIIIIFLLTVILLTLLAYLKYRSFVYEPIDSADADKISFQIKKGQSVKEIAKNLQQKSLIKNELAFYLHTKINKLGESIIAGRFLLNKTMNTPKILEIISDPSQAEFIITIQEGLTIKDIDKKLVEIELIKKGDFLKAVKNFQGWQYYSFLEAEILKNLQLPLEGYLYPDTYFLDPANFQAEDLIYLALDNFEKKLASLNLQPENIIFQKYTLHEIITMASIIENEVFGNEDRQIVSGILWKRLQNGWTLGADTTLLYISEDRKITEKELNTDSPYNTRKNLGLPPSPISNPSLESIKAAIYPKNSDYWFYLTTSDDKVIYSKSNEEHNLNKTKYL